MSVTIAKGMPGCPAGTVFDLDKYGNYRSTDGEFWFAPRVLIHDPDFIVQPPLEAGTVYYYVDGAGAVTTTAWEGTKIDAARKATGNYFQTYEAAKVAAAKVADVFGGKALTDEQAAEVIAEKAKG